MELLDEVDLDRESTAIILAYSLIGVLVLTAGYFFLIDGAQMEIIFEKEPLEPGEISRLQVVSSGEPVNGANVSIDNIYIGKTNSQGFISFEAAETNFEVVAVTKNAKTSYSMNVSTSANGKINSEFGEVFNSE